MRKQKYAVNGMHCIKCVRKIENALQILPEIKAAKVNLKAQTATIESVGPIPLSTITSLVSPVGSYILSPIGMLRYTLRQIRPFIPILLAFLIVICWTVLLGISSPAYMKIENGWMVDFMAGFFFLFGGLKVINIRAFANMYRTYDPITMRIPRFGFVYPFIELTLGTLYFFQSFLTLANILTIIFLTIGTYGIVQTLRRGSVVTCACLGGFFSVPLSWLTVFENLLMVCMAFFMLAAS